MKKKLKLIKMMTMLNKIMKKKKTILKKRKHMMNQIVDVGVVLGSDLPGDRHMGILNHGFYRHTAVSVVLQAISNNGVADLVTNLVRVSGGHLFAGKKHARQLLSGYEKSPTGCVSPRGSLDPVLLSVSYHRWSGDIQ